MSPLDLIRSRDGSMSLTKLSATTFHLLLAITVAWITWISRTFNEAMWGLYAAAAVGHAVIDKTGSQISNFKNKKLDVESPPSTVTMSTTTVEQKQ